MSGAEVCSEYPNLPKNVDVWVKKNVETEKRYAHEYKIYAKSGWVGRFGYLLQTFGLGVCKTLSVVPISWRGKRGLELFSFMLFFVINL